MRIACPSCGHALTLRKRASVPATPPLTPSSSAAPGPPADNPFDGPPSTPGAPEAHPGLLPGVPVDQAPPPKEAAYFSAPPGADTQMFMNVAGIYRQRRNRKIGAVTALVMVVLVGGIMLCDAKGIISLPWMGSLYAMTGMKDPNMGRSLARVESSLRDKALSPAEREALRKKLMGDADDATPTTTPKHAAKSTASAPMSNTPAPAAAPDLVDGDGKKEHVVGAVDDAVSPTPLSQDQIYKVINDNNRSMSLCYGEAARKGEKLRGKMEVQITIEGNGRVSDANVQTPKFQGTTMGDCTVRRVKNWKFPKFHGDAITVVFPYVLSQGF